MYLNELRVYYPRNPPPRIYRTGLGKLNNLSTTSPILQNEVAKKPKKPKKVTKYGKIYSRFMAPFKFVYFMMETSSIHGFNHLTTKKRHTSEYLLWLGAMIAGLYGFITISMSTLHRYQNNPTVVSIETNYKEWNTTLPAATICPEMKTDEDTAEDIVAARFPRFKGDDLESAQAFLEALARANYSSFRTVPNFTRIRSDDYLDSIVLMRNIMEPTVSNSNIENDELRDQQLVFNVNEMSICYSYNSQVAIYMNPTCWKNKNYADASTSFSFVGSPLDGDIYTQVMGINSGYTVYLHSPEEVPDISSKGSSAPVDSYKTQDVVATSIVSAPEIRSLSIAQRKCRFLHESDLEISSVYSYNLCRMECRMKLAYYLCGCVPYFYKPSQRPVCNTKGMMCLSRHSEMLIKLFDAEHPIDCKCLPPCNDVVFTIESENNMDWPLGTNLKWGMVKYPRRRLKREVLFGIVDVLVNMGGTAGLFFGCSVLSLVEILYFITLRLLWFSIKKV